MDSHLFPLVAASKDGSDGVSHAVVRAALSSNHVVLVHDGRRDEGGAKRHAEVFRKVAKDGAKPLFRIPCLEGREGGGRVEGREKIGSERGREGGRREMGGIERGKRQVVRERELKRESPS